VAIHPGHVEAGVIDAEAQGQIVHQRHRGLRHRQVMTYTAAACHVIEEPLALAPVSGDHLTTHHHHAQIAHDRQQLLDVEHVVLRGERL